MQKKKKKTLKNPYTLIHIKPAYPLLASQNSTFVVFFAMLEIPTTMTGKQVQLRYHLLSLV